MLHSHNFLESSLVLSVIGCGFDGFDGARNSVGLGSVLDGSGGCQIKDTVL